MFVNSMKKSESKIIPMVLAGMPGCMEMPSTWTEKTAREAGFDLRTLTSCHSCLDMVGTGHTLKSWVVKSSLNSRKSCQGQHEHETSKHWSLKRRCTSLAASHRIPYSDCTEKRNFYSETEVKKRCAITSNSLFFSTNHKIGF